MAFIVDGGEIVGDSDAIGVGPEANEASFICSKISKNPISNSATHFGLVALQYFRCQDIGQFSL
jgi:hypothetical protein